MDLTFDAETQAIRTEIRKIVEEEFRPLIEDTIDSIESYHELEQEHADITDDVRPQPVAVPEEERDRLRALARELGYWAMGVPREYGGGDLNLVQRCVVLEELSKHRMGLYQTGLGAFDLVPGLNEPAEPRPLFERATDDQMERFFKPALAGERESAFALTEPAAGSDPRGMESRAERDSETWTITGQKHYITFVENADFLLVFARTGPQGDLENHGITLFLVPTDAAGLDIARQQQVIRPQQPFELHFDGVTVPDDNVVGEVGEGLTIAKESLSEARIMYAATCLGPMDQAVRMGIEWANDRIISGSPLADRQAVQWKIAESAMEFQHAKYSVYHAATKYDDGEDVRHESSIAKYTATETLYEVLDRMIQIHGGMGVDADLPLERWLREARVRRIGQGPSEIHVKTVARNLLRGYEDPDPHPL